MTAQVQPANSAPRTKPIRTNISRNPATAKGWTEPRHPWPRTKKKLTKALSARKFQAQMVASQDALKRFAMKLCKREDMAQDLTQETLLKAWAARDQFKPGSSFLSWSFTILRNTWLNQVRRQKKFVAEYDEQAAQNTLCAPPSQLTTFDLADLQRAMSELPLDQLEAVMLVGPGDLTYEEAGKILGCAAGTVKSRASRARATLCDIVEGGRVKMALADTANATDIAEIFVAGIREVEHGGRIENVVNFKQTR
ncbi:sigma-70 family RNA polymerase sigma factor [Erythrobacter sp. SCSIO 43205]|uniref:sigma-70 family RNA polymerase sigma factor n=1 Tax=Erythrobacter sp. SCSIO 43205 TaxID=2779361 RepID=UPI001CA86689|nr:sigma-70 family RNA polymerase sigma factor [Erythrobacter sp. SCSIO 43205]UAB78399.1 sigma-70 family RNA polymerase sigma factor [Erythrobacter sp. SCSIO 43205]